VKGPLQILPQNAPLGGMLCIKFLLLFLLNTMFVVRTFCIEAAFFTNYRHPFWQNIDPLIPEEYRLLIYLAPGLFSLLINFIKLTLSMKPQEFQYFKSFPQFILCPMFSPIMFEGNPGHIGDNQPPVRVWRLGSVLNSFFMGCLPQILLLVLDYFRRVCCSNPWPFIGNQENNALIKHEYGNLIFSITTLFLYLCLTTIFFFWDSVKECFQENEASIGDPIYSGSIGDQSENATRDEVSISLLPISTPTLTEETHGSPLVTPLSQVPCAEESELTKDQTQHALN